MGSALDGRRAAALITRLPAAPCRVGGCSEAAVHKIIEAIRDRLVQRSLIGKRKLDRTTTRRQLDAILRDLGERYRALVRTGRIEVPAELAGLVQQVRDLEQRLEAQEREIEALENEQPSTT